MWERAGYELAGVILLHLYRGTLWVLRALLWMLFVLPAKCCYWILAVIPVIAYRIHQRRARRVATA